MKRVRFLYMSVPDCLPANYIFWKPLKVTRTLNSAAQCGYPATVIFAHGTEMRIGVSQRKFRAPGGADQFCFVGMNGSLF